MNFRLAGPDDLPPLNEVFRRIVAHMDEQGICIWDDVFPFMHFEEDVCKKRLHLLTDGETIAAAFSLCDFSEAAECVEWPRRTGKSLYFNRFGVNPDYQRRGVGSLALKNAALFSKESGVDCLRLFVVDINTPAIRLYEKNGFVRAGGIYREVIDEDLTLNEFGYELPL